MNGQILIVEDEPAVRMTMARLLKMAGYEVTMAGDALAATTAAARDKPDLVLLDLGLPAGGGAVVIERLRNLVATSLTPVIVVTGQFVDSARMHALAELGCDTVLMKPVVPEELLAAVDKALGIDRVSDGRSGGP